MNNFSPTNLEKSRVSGKTWSNEQIIEKEIPGIYVRSLKIYDNSSITEPFIEFSDETGEEIHASIHMPVNKQVELACKKISKDPNLQKGYNAIGYSQVTIENNCLNISVAHYKKKINLLQNSNL